MSLEYRLAPRDSAVDSPVGLAVSFSTSPSSAHSPRLPSRFPFSSLFSSGRLFVPPASVHPIAGHGSGMAGQVEEVTETARSVKRGEILFRKLLGYRHEISRSWLCDNHSRLLLRIDHY